MHARAFCRRAWLQSAHDLVCIIRALSSPKDPHDPRNFRKTIEKIMSADYAVPMALNLSPECLNLLRRMLDTNPFNRITIPQVRARVSSPELSISARSDDDKLPHFFFWSNEYTHAIISQTDTSSLSSRAYIHRPCVLLAHARFSNTLSIARTCPSNLSVSTNRSC